MWPSRWYFVHDVALRKEVLALYYELCFWYYYCVLGWASWVFVSQKWCAVLNSHCGWIVQNWTKLNLTFFKCSCGKSWTMVSEWGKLSSMIWFRKISCVTFWVPVDHMPIHPCASCQSLIGSSLLFSMEYEDSASNLSVLSSCCSSQQCAAFRVRNGSFERGAMKIPQCTSSPIAVRPLSQDILSLTLRHVFAGARVPAQPTFLVSVRAERT